MIRVGPGPGLQHCLDQGLNHNGEPPTCTKTANGTWVASWPDDSLGTSSGIPGFFVFFAVVIIAVGIGITVWRVSTARRLAQDSGMDPGLATQMTLLTENGLDATYLAASLRPSQATSPPQSPTPATPSTTGRSASERLTELASLRDQGMITEAEYDERRRSIIDGL